MMTLKFPYIDHEKENVIENTLKTYLKTINKENLFQKLSYILKEMTGNANKANFKRIHFLLKDLDIESKDDYEKGILNFKDNTSDLYQIYSQEADKRGFYVKIDMFDEEKYFIIIITNNCKILPVEKLRIESKINKAIRFHTIEDALNEALDQTEGAGLGIILAILMLRNIGLSEEVYNIVENKDYTQTMIKIPLSLLNIKDEEFIADTIKKEIEDIPQFPEHILQLQKILEDPESNFSDLSDIINNDPSLIADILKLANSSLYMMPKRVKTIEDAVRQIGFKGIKSLILTYSAQKLLADKFNLDLIKETIDHSIEVAYYAYELAKILKFTDLIEETYTVAILHDFGKIIVNSLKPEILNKISKICNEKGINSHIIENLTDGFNHSIIGARLAEKWNFPDIIIETIKYHHIPLEASDNNQILVCIIYLANIFYYYKRKMFLFTNINYQVLKNFNLTDQKDFENLFLTIDANLTMRKSIKEI